MSTRSGGGDSCTGGARTDAASVGLTPSGRRTQSPMAGGPSKSGLGAPVARASSSASEASTRGARAGDHLDRYKEGLSGLVHLSPSVLRGEVTHETGDCGEARREHLLHQ